MERALAHQSFAVTSELRVTRRRVIGPMTAWRLWRTYDRSFASLNRNTPCRQSFHRSQFLRLMADPRAVKVFVRSPNPDGIAVITRRFELLPWVSLPFFARLEAETGRPFAYVPILVVDPMHREGAVVAILLHELRAVAASRWGVRDLGFDVCEANSALPLLMARVLGPHVHVEAVGAQRYFTASELSTSAERRWADSVS